jgi:hypothetical protein
METFAWGFIVILKNPSYKSNVKLKRIFGSQDLLTTWFLDQGHAKTHIT